VLHVSNCYSLKCCYTRFVVLLFFQEVLEKLRLSCGSYKGSICLLRLRCNVFVSWALEIWCLNHRCEATASRALLKLKKSVWCVGFL